MEYTQKSDTVPGFADGLSTDAQGTGILILYPGSSRVDVHGPPSDAYVQFISSGEKRGQVKGFSAKSRRRLMMGLSKINRRERFIAITLTYQENVTDSRRAHRDLHSFFGSLKRSYPRMAAYWKLEYQDRGSIHFHLLLWATWLPQRWLAETWDRIAGHEFAGHSPSTRVERPRNSRNATRYMCSYLAKSRPGEHVDPVGSTHGRRVWGVHNRAFLPVARPHHIAITDEYARDILDEWSKRFNSPYRLNSVTIFMTDDQASWLESFINSPP